MHTIYFKIGLIIKKPRDSGGRCLKYRNQSVNAYIRTSVRLHLHPHTISMVLTRDSILQSPASRSPETCLEMEKEDATSAWSSQDHQSQAAGSPITGSRTTNHRQQTEGTVFPLVTAGAVSEALRRLIKRPERRAPAKQPQHQHRSERDRTALKDKQPWCLSGPSLV